MITQADVRANIHDYEWRMNNLYFIKDSQGRKVLFNPNQAQKHFNDNRTHLNIILKARQLGFSTFIDLLGFDLAFWLPNKEVVIQAQDRTAAEKLFEEKIQFPYDNLPASVRALNPLVKSNTREMKFVNGSIVRVVTSARSGTTNFLHISEFGKICAKSPEKAREVVTGSLNTVAPGQFVFIESTAEGREGAFYDMTQEAIKFQLEGRELSINDYSFHFYPWYQEPRYVANPGAVVISKNMHEYFDLLERMESVTISLEQRAWYCKKKISQKDDMKREFPSTPKEAFEQSIIGAYFPDEMALVRAEGRIRRIPYEPRLPVHTFWDIGRDTTSIWFMQHYAITNEYRFINYFQSCNHSLQWYVKEIYKLGYHFASHWFPHDGDVHSIDNPEEETRVEVIRKLGLTVEVVPRIDQKVNAIQAARDILNNCYFDEENCEEGIKHLDHYRKEWDDKLGTYKNDKPLHDSHSHGADSFQQFATGYKIQKDYKDADIVPEVENVW